MPQTQSPQPNARTAPVETGLVQCLRILLDDAGGDAVLAGVAPFETAALTLPDGKPGRLCLASAWLWRCLVREALTAEGASRKHETALDVAMRQTLEALGERAPEWDQGTPSLRGLWLLLAGSRDPQAMTWAPTRWMKEQKGVDAVTLPASVRALAEAYTRVMPGLAAWWAVKGRAWDGRVRRGIFHQIEHVNANGQGLSGIRQWRTDVLLGLPPPPGEEDSTLRDRLFPLVCREMDWGASVTQPEAFVQAAVRYLDATRGVAERQVFKALLQEARHAAPQGLRAFGVRSPASVQRWAKDWTGKCAWRERLGQQALHAIYEAQARHDRGGAGVGADNASGGVAVKPEDLRRLHGQVDGGAAAALVEVTARVLDAHWRPADERPALTQATRIDATGFRRVAELLLCCERARTGGEVLSGAGRAALRRLVGGWMKSADGRRLLAGGWAHWLGVDPAAHPARALGWAGIDIDVGRVLKSVQHGTPGPDSHAGKAMASSDAAFRLHGSATDATQSGRLRRRC